MNDTYRFPFSSRLLRGLIKGLTIFFLMISLVGVGFFLCCAPPTTTALSQLFSTWEGTAFTQEELTAAAEATRDYTVGSHDRSEILQALYALNKSAADAGRAGEGAPDLSGDSVFSDGELTLRLSLADEAYTLDSEALDHLDDVYEVAHSAHVMIIGLFIFALIGCIVIGFGMGRRHLGRALMAAPILILILFVALAVWVIVDFNSFFTFLHSLFFADGTWTFSFDSLLIRMYPTQFWVGMGVVWFLGTSLTSTLCLILGKTIKGRKQ